VKLYNTLTRQIELLKPQNPPDVTVYTCGPTVYYYPHIGNWFTFIRYDLVVRTLQTSGLKVKWVMNITDVGHLVSDGDEGEDKLEKGARREGKTAWQVAAFYGDYFVKGLDRLNIRRPDYLPKATDHIAEQIQLVQQLETKGFTYVIDDGVYYDTSKFPRYADFARLDVDDQQAGARIEQNPQKRSITDFALWKFSPKDHQRDMEWDSPWGKGFPGWHLECSAMSMKYLGKTIDLHAGGIDHIPVHHTNEIAQSQAVTGQPLANYWMHTNHVTVDDEKISKSLGNTITLEDIESKGLDLMAFRLHVLESHYRSQSKFSWRSLEAASRRLKSLEAMADLIWQPIGTSDKPVDFEVFAKQILADMQDDLNTPSVLASLSGLQTRLEENLLGPADIKAFEQFLKSLDQILGLRLSDRSDITANQKQLIKDRTLARVAEDWQKSDDIRNQLANQGLGLRDTPQGAVWYRTTQK
jgi:cysteinyl-tRNA synthetase